MTRLWGRRRCMIMIITTYGLLFPMIVYIPWTTIKKASFLATLTDGDHRLLAVVDDQAKNGPTSKKDRTFREFPRHDGTNYVKCKQDKYTSKGRHEEGLDQDMQRRSQNHSHSNPLRMKADLSSHIRADKIGPEFSIDVDFVRKTNNNQTRSREGGECLPHSNIVFWKTHKCGSSTMQNMILRYAVKNDLRVLLPPKTHLFNLRNRFNATRDVPREFIEMGNQFNVFAHHARFSAADIAPLMPRDSIYITILRSPLTLYESIYSYLGLERAFGNETHPVKIVPFLKNPNSFYKTSDLNVHRRYARNPLLYDLGLDPEDMERKEKIADTILEVQLRFHFVMITEYFDESLVLLKELMCWNFDDIAYLRLNARKRTHRTSSYAANLIQKWNYGDTQLYQYFNDSFWKRVEAYGRTRMERDVRTLRDLNARLMDRCVEEETNADDVKDQETYWHPKDVDIISYQLKASAKSDQTCRDIIKSGKQFTEKIRAKQGDYIGQKPKERNRL